MAHFFYGRDDRRIHSAALWALAPDRVGRVHDWRAVVCGRFLLHALTIPPRLAAMPALVRFRDNPGGLAGMRGGYRAAAVWAWFAFNAVHFLLLVRR